MRPTYLHQMLWYGLGVGAAVGVCYFEYGSLARWSALFYWGSIVLLLAVFAVGTAHHGGKRWILWFATVGICQDRVHLVAGQLPEPASRRNCGRARCFWPCWDSRCCRLFWC